MQKIYIERPIFYGILSRIFNLIAVPITGVLIASVFSAHEWPSLRLDNEGNIISDNLAFSRLARL